MNETGYVWMSLFNTIMPLLSRFSALQHVAVCCSMLQCVAVYCSVLQCVPLRCSVLQRVAECCSVLQRVAVCCSVLQCVAACCNVSTIKQTRASDCMRPTSRHRRRSRGGKWGWGQRGGGGSRSKNIRWHRLGLLARVRAGNLQTAEHVPGETGHKYPGTPGVASAHPRACIAAPRCADRGNHSYTSGAGEICGCAWMCV